MSSGNGWYFHFAELLVAFPSILDQTDDSLYTVPISQSLTITQDAHKLRTNGPHVSSVSAIGVKTAYDDLGTSELPILASWCERIVKRHFMFCTGPTIWDLRSLCPKDC